MQTIHPFLDIQPDVLKALNNQIPIVALESTIISHGMPYPENLQTALMLEQEIRKQGAIPATIALLDGRIKVGLNLDEIKRIALEGEKVHKTSKRDLAYVLSQKTSGATTVAATMIIAEMVGIKIFATGGIGGVHRDGENTLDISADLQELSKTNVAVVCAGVKSILDIGLTLEYLETMGVPVIGYRTGELPAFFTSKSGFKVDFNLKSAKEIANYMKTKELLGINHGILITQAIPKVYDYPKETIDAAINLAVATQKDKGITGKESTPFLLKRIAEITKGKSLESNIALVKNNAKLAAQIAVKLSI